MSGHDPPRPVGLAGPAMPGARMDPPAMAVVRATRRLYESAKNEVAVKLNTAARYQAAFEKTRDPELLRTANTEMMLARRQLNSVLKPAAAAYAEAIARAVAAGHSALGGSFSHEEAIRRLVDIDAYSQLLGVELLFTRTHWASALERVAEDALRLCAEHDERGYRLALMCRAWADVLGEHPRWVGRIDAMFEQHHAAWIEQQRQTARALHPELE